MTAKIPWLRVLAEGFVIVVSILLALALDAWWDERQDRTAEQEALSRLRAEFVAAGDAVSGPTPIAASGMRLHELFTRLPSGGSEVTVPDTLLAAVLGTPVYDPTTPVLDGLISSGRLALITDGGVRDALAHWQRWLGQLADFEAGRQVYADRQLRAGLMERGDMSTVLLSDVGFNRLPLDPTGMTRLRVDDELKGLVAEKQAIARAVNAVRELLAAAADSVVVAIDKAQGAP